MDRFVSPLSWVGGKAKQWKMIKEQLPNKVNLFVDLFTGGGSVCLNAIKDGIANKYVMNDLNTKLIDFWKLLQNGNTYSISIPNDLEHAKQNYLGLPEELKYWFNNTLNFGGFEKGTWSNSRLQQNFTQSKIDRLNNCSKLLNINELTIKNMDYEAIFKAIINTKKNLSDTFIFLDPPYFYNEGKVYKYGYINFKVLKNWLDEFSKLGGEFLLTIDDSSMIKELFKDYIIIEKEWKYTSTNAKGNSKTKMGKELFIRNYKLIDIKKEKKYDKK